MQVKSAVLSGFSCTAGWEAWGGGKEIATERINISSWKRIDSGGAWVIKTRHKTQTDFNTQKKLQKLHRDMDRHLCHPCASTRQLHAEGGNRSGHKHLKGWSDNPQSQWMGRPSITVSATSQQCVGLAWYFVPNTHLHAMECILLSKCPVMAAWWWDDSISWVMPSSHSMQREGLEAVGATCGASPICYFLRLLVHAKKTWLLQNKSDLKRTGIVF